MEEGVATEGVATEGVVTDDTINEYSVGADQFHDWVESTKPSLLRYARKCLSAHMVAHYDPEDLLQDSLCATWRVLHQAELKDKQAFARWMRRVLRNRAFDLFKLVATRNERGQGVHDELQDAFVSITDPRSSTPQVALRRQEHSAAVLSQLRELSFDQRLCFVLNDVVGMRWRFTSAILGRTVGGAKGVRYRAQAMLAPDCEFDM